MKILLLALSLIGSLAGCTSPSPNKVLAPAVCANVDWFEAGRSDGRLGYPVVKMRNHGARCASGENPLDEDMYKNGREAGLLEFCSVAGALEAGRSGIPYEKVCPEHLEKAFLASYEIGRRIEELESDNVELESRISTLASLSAPSEGSSMRAQIEQLRARRAQNNSEITNLESKASAEL